MTPGQRAQYIQKLLYHFGKGLWKGIPVLGSIVEEVGYEAHKDELSGQLTNRLGQLSDDDLHKIVVMMNNIEASIEDEVSKVRDDLTIVEDKIDLTHAGIESVKTMIESLREELRATIPDAADRDRLERRLASLEQQRLDWVGGISATQRALLAVVPDRAEARIPWPELFEKARADVRGLRAARDQELHFRLHELRWLGLIDRRRASDSDANGRQWQYWQTPEGRELPRPD